MNATTTATPPLLGRRRRDRDLAGLERLRWAVRAVLMLGVAASIAANVLHARPNLISELIAAWPPLALLLTVELTSRVPADRRALAATRLISAAIIAGIAAWVSYWHMVGVAARYGETGAHANYLLPVSVDGLVVVASISLVEIAGRIDRSHRTSTSTGSRSPDAAQDAATAVNHPPTPPAGGPVLPAGVPADGADGIAAQPLPAAVLARPAARGRTMVGAVASGVALTIRGPQPPQSPDADHNDQRQPPHNTDTRDGAAEATRQAQPGPAGAPAVVDEEPAVLAGEHPDSDHLPQPAPDANGGASVGQDAHRQPRPAHLEIKRLATATVPTANGNDHGRPVGAAAHLERTDAAGHPHPRDAGSRASTAPLDGGTQAVPSDTAAAVAYWYRRDPQMNPADIAAKIGRSERTVRRYWPPQPALVNGDHAHDLQRPPLTDYRE